MSGFLAEGCREGAEERSGDAEEVGERGLHWWEPKADSSFCEGGRESVKWRGEFGERKDGFSSSRVISAVTAGGWSSHFKGGQKFRVPRFLL